MNVPEDFRYFASCFHQDISLEVSGEEELIAYLLGFLNDARKAVVKNFLDELLAGDPSGEELQQVWRDCEPDWGFRNNEDLRLFLTMVRDRIPS